MSIQFIVLFACYTFIIGLEYSTILNIDLMCAGPTCFYKVLALALRKLEASTNLKEIPNEVCTHWASEPILLNSLLSDYLVHCRTYYLSMTTTAVITFSDLVGGIMGDRYTHVHFYSCLLYYVIDALLSLLLIKLRSMS